MPKEELLPGVTTSACPPRVLCDAHGAIRSARRRAFLRDAIQVALLIAIDWLFVRWPEMRMPFLDRADSLALLRGVNVIIIGHLWLTRALPRWTARRTATTWCRSERAWFEAAIPARSGGSSSRNARG